MEQGYIILVLQLQLTTSQKFDHLLKLSEIFIFKKISRVANNELEIPIDLGL